MKQDCPPGGWPLDGSALFAPGFYPVVTISEGSSGPQCNLTPLPEIARYVLKAKLGMGQRASRVTS
jgi:hypothetical protein